MSVRHHSTRVPDRIATRSPRDSPAAISPMQISRAASPAWRNVMGV